jgi:hypothetical protein
MKKKITQVMNKDFIEGLKTGLKIAQDVVKKQGHGCVLYFPDVDEILIEREKKK